MQTKNTVFHRKVQAVQLELSALQVGEDIFLLSFFKL